MYLETHFRVTGSRNQQWLGQRYLASENTNLHPSLWTTKETGKRIKGDTLQWGHGEASWVGAEVSVNHNNLFISSRSQEQVKNKPSSICGTLNIYRSCSTKSEQGKIILYHMSSWEKTFLLENSIVPLCLPFILFA